MSKKKLIKIDGNSTSSQVTFYFDDSSHLTFDIDGDKNCTYLFHNMEHNAEA